YALDRETHRRETAGGDPRRGAEDREGSRRDREPRRVPRDPRAEDLESPDHTLETGEPLVCYRPHDPNKSRRTAVSHLRLEVRPLSTRDLLLVRERIGLTRKVSLSVGGLSHDERDRRGGLSVLIDRLTRLLETHLEGLSVDRCLTEGHAILLDRVALAL